MDLTRVVHTIRVLSPGSNLEFQNSPSNQPKPSLGLECFREAGVLPALDGEIPPGFVERRVCLLFTSDRLDWTSDDGFQIAANFRILLFSDALGFGDLENSLRVSDLEKRGLTIRGARSGFMLFQAMLLDLLAHWAEQWQSSLDEIDGCVKVKLANVLDARTSEDLMFDKSFQKSRVYFQVLQVLRIFSESIRETGTELKSLSNMLGKRAREDYNNVDIHNNWNLVLGFQVQEELKLLQRIAEKTEEIKSLRDGLFNATSLLETSKATSMNRYIIVFTIVTVAFLPPSFVATVFGTDLFNSDDTDGAITKFKFTTVAVSLITYLVAFFLVWLADRMNSVRKLRTYTRKKVYRLVLRFRMSPTRVEPGEDQDSEIQLEEDQASESRVRSHWWKPRLPHFMTRHRKKQEAEA
ncbi:hypothetical protein QBC37DRAFT_284332 [Rhypophila decipiens]|uniref:Uncharacterized protein n=1 Tax=Rhypophila decipiens TaxID=261697 RepID=A0AAN6Y7S2_9PEZI|nr:hypothetical protein QBC37DRAFT_284332 [Rhypophila decipiens]